MTGRTDVVTKVPGCYWSEARDPITAPLRPAGENPPSRGHAAITPSTLTANHA